MLGEQLARAARVPVAEAFDGQLDDVESEAADTRREIGQALVGQRRNPDPGVGPDRFVQGVGR